MPAGSDVEALVIKYSCPIGKERCPGPVVRKEGGKTFLVCNQVAAQKAVASQEIKRCGDELPVLLFVSFMASGKNK